MSCHDNVIALLFIIEFAPHLVMKCCIGWSIVSGEDVPSELMKWDGMSRQVPWDGV